jgi:hypothetical protein
MADFAVSDIFKTIDELAPQYGVDPGVAKSIITAENTTDGKISRKPTFSGSATNENRTMGIGQVIPATARGLQGAGLLPADWKFDPNDLKSQLSASLAAMKDMRSRLKNPDDPFELGAYYNGGTNGLRTYQSGGQLVPETNQYLGKMRTAMAELNMTPQQIERAANSGQVPGGTRTGSRSTSTSSTSFDPAALDNFQQQAGIVQNQLIPNAFAAVTDRGGQIAGAGMDLMSSIMQAGNDAAEAARTKATLEATGQARRAAILTKANLDPAVANNRFEQAITALDTTTAAIDQMTPEIMRRMEVGFFDNPLEYLVNQTRLPGMIQQHNNLVQIQQEQLGKFQAAKDIAGSAIDISQGIDADATLVAGNALAKATASKAAQEAAQVRLQLSGKAAADALSAVQLGTQAADLSYKQLMLTRQQQYEREGLSEKEASKKADEAALSDVNLMVKAAGGMGMSLDRFKQLPAADRAELLKSMSIRKFGSDFSSAIKFVEEYGNFDNMAQGGQLAVRTWVNDTTRAASGEVQKQLIAAQNPATLNKSFNPQKAMVAQLDALAQGYTAAANVDMRGQPDANPFKLAYKTWVKVPELQNNIWAQQIAKYGPGGTEQQFETVDEQQFLKKAIININLSGDPAVAVKKYAADISNFYQAATKLQRDATKPQLFGLSTPAKTYPVILPNFQTGNKAAPVDLGNPTEVENLLTRQVARTRALSDLSIFAVGEKLQTRQQLGMKPFGE